MDLILVEHKTQEKKKSPTHRINKFDVLFRGKANMPKLDLFNVIIQSFYNFFSFFVSVPKASLWLIYCYYNKIVTVINTIEINKN